MRTRIKFCGIKQPSDLAYAAALGVDAVGLVFHPSSPRHIEIEDAHALVRKADRMIKIVSLFMNASHALVARVVRSIRVDYIQFHGTESVDFCRAFDVPYIKAIPMADDSLANEMIEAHRDTADILLLDGHRAAMPGGRGVAFAWRDLSKIGTVVFAAGGLSPDNVEGAIAQCRPHGVDVSSGIESSVGIKARTKMAAFVGAVLRADYNRSFTEHSATEG